MSIPPPLSFQGGYGARNQPHYNYGYCSGPAPSWPPLPMPTPAGSAAPLPFLMNHHWNIPHPFTQQGLTPLDLPQLISPFQRQAAPMEVSSSRTAPAADLDPFIPPAKVARRSKVPKVTKKRSTSYPKTRASRSRTPSRKQLRKASIVASQVPPATAPIIMSVLGHPVDAVNLARRPEGWRADYKPPNPSRALSRKITQSIRDVIGAKRDYRLTPLLEYTTPQLHPVAFDLRIDPMDGGVDFLNVPRATNELDFLQLATDPPQREMCLWHPRLPWYIYIRESQDNGITIQDILCQIFNQLSMRIRHTDLYNEALDARTREGLSTAYYYRCGNNAESMSNGVLRMDFLEFDVVFLGLKKSGNGMWEIKTREADP